MIETPLTFIDLHLKEFNSVNKDIGVYDYSYQNMNPTFSQCLQYVFIQKVEKRLKYAPKS